MDYCLELRDFHAGSRGQSLIPIVCAGGLQKPRLDVHLAGGVADPLVVAPASLALAIRQAANAIELDDFAPDWQSWVRAPYAPTPTILEAARALYSGHSVRDLSISEASAQQLQETETAIREVVERAQSQGKNAACFVTGVPGAGKTLAGLNVVHGLEGTVPTTFLSGNGPLVKVLQEVLAVDLAHRDDVTKAEGRRRAQTLVTNVHRWLDYYSQKHPDEPPRESLVVFDEAQRAWDRDQSMRKFKRAASEPELMLSIMSRRRPSVLVGLVGNGQEINTGEAGLEEWGRALGATFQDWEIAVSPQAYEGDVPGQLALATHIDEKDAPRIRHDPRLHLAVPQRSFRAERLSKWVEHVLSFQPDEASREIEHLREYPIVLTRDLGAARTWLRRVARGNRRAGLLVSSGARRLRPDGIAVREQISEVDWFLRPPDDVRSSSFLELAISEFGVQGLEVDWSCLAWGGDLTPRDDAWEIRAFSGTKWNAVRNEAARSYAINRYRVLLTRAREGMVIWVPKGDRCDLTRDPDRFEAVAEYLIRCGVKTTGS